MRVALYVRVSTEEQAQEGFSIEGQIKTLFDYCEKNNYEVVRTYKDEGLSAKSIDGRPQLKAMVNDCSKGIFDCILVWKTNRLSRKQYDLLSLLECFDKNNIKFQSFSEPTDVSTSMGKAMLQMMGVFSELERSMIIENVKMGMNQRALQGKWNGGSMLGYTSKNKKLVIVEREAEIVRYVYKLYIESKGYKAIANKLNHEGYKTKRDKYFSINSVRQIIINPAYAGYIRFNVRENWSEKRRKGISNNPIIVKGEHEPIIDIEIWGKAQSILKQKSSKPSKTFTGHFPLTTLLRCPNCGQGMIGHRVKNSTGEYIRYYQCGNFHYKGSAVCGSNLIRADYAEEIVFKRLEEITSSKSILRQIVDKVNDKIATHKDPLINQLRYNEEQIKKVKTNMNKYFQLFESDDMLPDILKNKLKSLQLELKNLKTRKNEIQVELSKPIIKEVPFEKVYDLLSKFSTIIKKVAPEKQKSLLHAIINKITINASNNIKERSIKDIELFFDTSLKPNFVLTCDTVHRY